MESLAKIVQKDIYQLDKSSLLGLIKECSVEPEPNCTARDLRKIGAFLKLIGKIVETDVELQNAVAELIEDPNVQLNPRNTTVCPELEHYRLLLQGNFKSFLEKAEKVTESLGASAPLPTSFKVQSPRQRPPPPPIQSPVILSKGDSVDTSIAINVLAEELKKVQGLVQRVVEACEIKSLVENTDGWNPGDRETARSIQKLNIGPETVVKETQRPFLTTEPKVDNLNKIKSNEISANLAKPSFDLVQVLPTFSGDNDEIVSDFIAQVDEVGNISN